MRSLPRQFRTYISDVLWIARDGILHRPGRVVAVTAINLFGVLSGAATLVGVLLYARHLERGDEAINLFGRSLELVDDTRAFMIFGLVLAAFGVFSAISLYAGEWLVSRLTVQYQHRIASRLLQLAADPDCAGWQRLLRGEPRRGLLRLLGMGVKLTAFAYRNILRAILPVLTFFVAVAALVWIDRHLTLLLLPVVLVYLVPLYLLNRGAARLHRQYVEHSPKARLLVNEALRDSVESAQPAEERRRAARAAFDDPIHDHVARLFWRRKLATFRIQMLNTSFFVVTLIALFILFGIETRTGDRTWSEFLGYIVALQFALGAVRGTTARFIKISRFLPEYHRYIRFVDGARGLRNARRTSPLRSRPLPDPLSFRCGGERQWDGASRLNINAGQTLWIISDRPATASNLQHVLVILETRCRDEVDLVSGAMICGISLRDINGQDARVAAMADRRSDLINESTQHSRVLIAGARTINLLPANATESRSGGAMPRLKILVAGDADAPLADAEDEHAARHVESPEATGVAGVIIMLEGRIVAAGDLDWLRQHRHEINEALSTRRREIEDDETELELDEDDV